MPDADALQTMPCFQLKGANVPLTALELRYFEVEAFEETLRDKIRQAPGFFRDIPLVVDLSRYKGPSSELDFFQLIGICRRHSMHVVAVRGGDEDQQRLARNASLALLPASSRPESPAGPDQETASQDTPSPEPTAEAARPVEQEQTVPAESRLITQPVRSGQQIYAPDGDLIILAPVQAGAEVLAAGNIHVYGPLRGRALAGVHGRHTARVFCQSLEAELVSIAGHYKISEDLQEKGWKAPAQIQLKENVLAVSPLA
ncbi:septum site-determining protein MinC [Tamilnaduibacter salinus]|uniref:Probable septum site-determining protein MinC n=1 Tax=Tamilnaduibacter salinus TaxID=1484056 RepID=A0A2U1D0V7_9GAMM|nr:septum site-determining protein MinC [Tamilnaduibacter salinus]PVY78938.1 septum site-determining protein MinC [Tamilnaduibacter salinus]